MIDIKELQSLTSKMSILYVEDDVEVQNNTKMIFEDLFKEVAIAQNGKEALEMYTNQADTFDIIITDINMPIMNGIELVQGVKKINSEQTIIIIL
jgi:CheY-like chemotaxis protein